MISDFHGRRASGKTYAMVYWLRASHKNHVIIPNRLDMLDRLISMGAKPSQITLSDELIRSNYDPYNVIFDEMRYGEKEKDND